MTTQTPSPEFIPPAKDTIIRGDILTYSWGGISILIYAVVLAAFGYLAIVSEPMGTRVIGGGILGLSSLACLNISCLLFRETIISRTELANYLKQHPLNGIRPESIRFSLTSLVPTIIITYLAIHGILSLTHQDGHVALKVVITVCLGVILLACAMLITNPVASLRDRIL